MERKALLVCADPQYFGKSHVDMAAAAGLTGRQLTRCKRNPAFSRAVMELTFRRCGEALPAIVAATVKSALIPGRDGFPDRQLLLKMFGISGGTPPSWLRDLLGAGEKKADGGTAANRLSRALTRRPELEAEADQVRFDDAIGPEEGAKDDDFPLDWGEDDGEGGEEPQ